MEISLNDWTRFIDTLSKISSKAAADMRAFIIKGGGYANIPANELIDYAYALATKYGEASATLSAMMYDDIAFLSEAAVPAAIPAATASYGDVAKTIEGSAKFSENVDYLSEVVGRLVKQAGADTTLQNAIRDGAEVAWIPHGDTCMFCLTLASRGWQRASKQTIKNGHAEHIHSNCDCTYSVRFSESTKVEGYDPDEYLKIYQDAEGSTPKAKINYMRREAYALNKDKINEQKRAAYAKRKELESSEAEEIDVN